MSHPSLTVASKRLPFVTLHASDLDGPRTRQRLLCYGRPERDWLVPYAAHVGVGQVMIAVGMGRAALGATTRVRSIVSFAPFQGREPFACIYVEEHAGPATGARLAAPVHIVRCAGLPARFRFVEIVPARATLPHGLGNH